MPYQMRRSPAGDFFLVTENAALTSPLPLQNSRKQKYAATIHV